MKEATIRLEESYILEVKKLAEREGKSISEAMHEILKKGLRDYKIEKTIKGCCRRSRDYTARVSSRVEAEGICFAYG